MTFSTITATLALIGLTSAPLAAQEVPTPGTITVEPLAEDAASPEARRVFAEAVAGALADANFLALPAGNRGRYVARMTLSRRAQGSVAVNGAEAGADGNVGNWGAALRVTLPSGKRELRSLVVTELGIEILRRDGMQPVWSGRALTVAPQGTPSDAPAVIAGKLSGAVMRGFPLQRAEPVSVP